MSARTVVEHALTVYYDGNTELVSQLLANLRAEEAAPAAPIPPVPDNTTGDEGLAEYGCPKCLHPVTAGRRDEHVCTPQGGDPR